MKQNSRTKFYPQKQKLLQKNNLHQKQSLSECFHIARGPWSDQPIGKLSLSQPTLRILQNIGGIKTIGDLLDLSTETIVSAKGMGAKKLLALIHSLKLLKKETASSILDEATPEQNPITLSAELKPFRFELGEGIWSSADTASLSVSAYEQLQSLKERFSFVDGPLLSAARTSPKDVFALLKRLQHDFDLFFQLRSQIDCFLDCIPQERLTLPASRFIFAMYPNQPDMRQILHSCFVTNSATLENIRNYKDISDYVQRQTLLKFLDWCSFDITNELEVILPKVLPDNRKQEILHRRANGETLNAIGQSLQCTGERIRQLEAECVQKFNYYEARHKLFLKTFAAFGHDGQLLYDDCDKAFGQNAKVVFYLFTFRSPSNCFFQAETKSFSIQVPE